MRILGNTILMVLLSLIGTQEVLAVSSWDDSQTQTSDEIPCVQKEIKKNAAFKKPHIKLSWKEINSDLEDEE